MIVRHLVAEARRHGADAVAHGCTGKGNDQVRFEVGTRALAPDLEILAPARVWGMTREDCIDYAARHAIPVEATKEKLYSIDENLWGRAIECGAIEDPWAAPPSDVFTLTRPTASEPRDLVVGFEAGVPVSVDGRPLGLAQLIAEVGAVVGAYGWGRIDMVENRRVGIKSRETYECPAALALMLAHGDLEDLTLERDVAHEKARLEPRWAELVYDGLWFSPLKEALDAFFASTQRHVTGEVRLSPVARQLCGVGAAQPGVALRPRAGHLRRRGHLRPRRRRRLRAPLGTGRGHVGRPPGWPADDAGAASCGKDASAATAEEVMAFTVSLPFDRRLAADDLVGSRAHVRGLVRAGILDERRGGHPAGRPRPGGGGAGVGDLRLPPRRTRTSTPPSSAG